MKASHSMTFTLALLIALPGVALAQTESESSSTVMESMKGLHEIASGYVMQTAEMLEEEMYAYRPTEEVRSAGEILAHVAGAQYMFCSAAAGEESPSSENYEEMATTKDDIVSALQSSTEYCGSVYDGMTDEAGAEMRDLFGRQMAATAVLAFNSVHVYEHYGNLVTYMRMNDIVPPSSQ